MTTHPRLAALLVLAAAGCARPADDDKEPTPDTDRADTDHVDTDVPPPDTDTDLPDSDDDTDPADPDTDPADSDSDPADSDTDPADSDSDTASADSDSDTDPADSDTDTDPPHTDPGDTAAPDTDPGDTDPTPSACAPLDTAVPFDLDHPLCAEPDWCWGWPLPHGLVLQGVDAPCPDDVWAVGAEGVVQRWDGARWTLWQHPDRLDLRRVAALGPDEAWVAAVDRVSHLSGGVFVDTPLPGLGAPGGLHVFAPDDVWLAGTGGTWRFDGVSWTSTSTTRGRNLAATGPDDVWTLSTTSGAPHLFHFDGQAWTPHTLPGAPSGFAAAVHSPERGILWVLRASTVHRYDHGTWATWTLPPQPSGVNAWRSIHARDAEHVTVWSDAGGWELGPSGFEVLPPTSRLRVRTQAGRGGLRVSVGDGGVVRVEGPAGRRTLAGDTRMLDAGLTPGLAAHDVTRGPDGALHLFGQAHHRWAGDRFEVVAPRRAGMDWVGVEPGPGGLWGVQRSPGGHDEELRWFDGAAWTLLATAPYNPSASWTPAVIPLLGDQLVVGDPLAVRLWDGATWSSLGGGSLDCGAPWFDAPDEGWRACRVSSPPRTQRLLRRDASGWSEVTTWTTPTSTTPDLTLRHPDGTLITIASDHVARWDGATVTLDRLPVAASNVFFARAFAVAGDTVHVVGQLNGRGGLATLAPDGSWTVREVSPRVASSVFVDDDGTLWVGAGDLFVSRPGALAGP